MVEYLILMNNIPEVKGPFKLDWSVISVNFVALLRRYQIQMVLVSL